MGNALDDYLIEDAETDRITRKDGVDVRDNNFEALASGFSRGLTWGTDDTINAVLGGGEGDTYPERKKSIESRERALANQNSFMDFVGETAGSVAFDLAATKGLKTAGSLLVKGGRTLKGAMTSIGDAQQALASNAWGRIGMQGVGGLVQGGGMGYFEDEDVLTHALFGGGGGLAGGAVLGELLPSLNRVINTKRGAKGFAKAQANKRAQIEQEVYDRIEASGVEIANHEDVVKQVAEKFDELGPDATLEQANDVMRQFGLNTAANPRYADVSTPYMEKVKSAHADAPKRFEAIQGQLMDGPVLSPDMVGKVAKDRFKKYSKRLDTSLAKFNGKFNADNFAAGITEAFTRKSKSSGKILTATGKESAMKLKADKVLFDIISNKGYNFKTAKGNKITKLSQMTPDQLAGVKLTAHDAESVRSGLSSLYKAKASPFKGGGDPGSMQLLANSQKQLSKFLKETIPGYKSTMRKYATEHEYKAAYDNGVKFASQATVDPANYATYMKSLSKPEYEAFMNGTKYSLGNRFGRKNPLKDAKLIEEDQFVQDRLRMAFPDIADPMIARAKEYAIQNAPLERTINIRNAVEADKMAPGNAASTLTDTAIIADPNAGKAGTYGAIKRRADNAAGAMTGQGKDSRYIGGIMDMLSGGKDETLAALGRVGERQMKNPEVKMTISDVMGMLGGPAAQRLIGEDENKN